MNYQNNLENDESSCCPSLLSCFLSSVFPCYWCCSCHTINEREEAVYLRFGKFEAVYRKPGLYCLNTAGLEGCKISTAIQSFDVPKLKVVDQCGNPLIVSGVVTYQVVDSKRAAIDVVNYRHYLSTQSEVVLRQICTLYPYQSSDEKAESLKDDAQKVKFEITKLLQEKASLAGIQIIAFEFKELSYAPEIAANMLLRQQAQARLSAKQIIVVGAVAIAHGAVDQMKKSGMELSKNEESRLVGNLLLTMCSETGIQPTIDIAQ